MAVYFDPSPRASKRRKITKEDTFVVANNSIEAARISRLGPDDLSSLSQRLTRQRKSLENEQLLTDSTYGSKEDSLVGAEDDEATTEAIKSMSNIDGSDKEEWTLIISPKGALTGCHPGHAESGQAAWRWDC